MRGYNGIINDQGQAWWTKYKKRILANTRWPLVQLMWFKDNITKITLCVTLHLGHFIRLIARKSLSCLPFLELQTQMGLTQTIVPLAARCLVESQILHWQTIVLCLGDEESKNKDSPPAEVVMFETSTRPLKMFALES